MRDCEKITFGFSQTRYKRHQIEPSSEWKYGGIDSDDNARARQGRRTGIEYFLARLFTSVFPNAIRRRRNGAARRGGAIVHFFIRAGAPARRIFGEKNASPGLRALAVIFYS